MKTTVILVGVFALAASAANAETRYLAAGGDDAADGRTPATAWRTVEKANAALPSGATLRLRSGDVFYGGLKLPSGPDAAHPTVLTSWGEGPKPVISATKNLKPDPSAWQDRSHCFWRINLANPSNFTGLVTDDCNPGFLLVDGEVKPWKRFCRGDLVSPWDFCGEDGWLYVHADENPATLAKDIRVALRVPCVQFGSHAVISNVAVRTTGAHGMHGGWGCDLEHVRISDCEFENIGGSELTGFSPQMRIRYGNGVELGGDAADVVVERCSFRGVYDVCFTMQGFPKKGWRDVHCRACTMTDCTQAFEIWCQRAPKGVGFTRCSFTGNRTLRVGGGWGELTRPCRRVATPLLIYMLETDTVDIDVRGNVFEEAPHGLIYCRGGRENLPAGYRIEDNDLLPRASGDIDVVVVYYPHWHKYPKGTEWFGEAWDEGEWAFVKTAVPRYPGHRVPIQPLPGYLNGRDPKDVATEIALASNAGIDVFLYDYYYYGGKVTQEEAIEEGFLKAENRQLMKFALMWCYHDRRDQFRPPVDRKERRLLMRLERTPEEFLGLIDLSIKRYFGRPEYWRKDGKLFFSIFGGWDFIPSLGKDAAARALKEARRRVAAAGLGEIHFNVQGLRPDQHDLAREVGFDSMTDYNVVPRPGP